MKKSFVNKLGIIKLGEYFEYCKSDRDIKTKMMIHSIPEESMLSRNTDELTIKI